MNPYHQLRKVVKDCGIDPERLVHALMATVYLKCCHSCAGTLRSEEFVKAVDRMAHDLLRCAELSKQNAA